MQFQNVSIVGGDGALVDSVTFDGCHIGVSNGVKAGSPFAGLICWTPPSTTGKGWSNINVIDTVFEVSDWHCIDLASPPPDGGVAHGGPALIRGCTLKGAAAQDLCIEGPVGVEVDRTTFYAAGQTMLGAGAYRNNATNYTNYNVHDCVFDSGAVTGADWAVTLKGGGNKFTNNVIDAVSQMVLLEDYHHGAFSGNVCRDHSTRNANYVLVVKNCSSNNLTHSKFWNASTSGIESSHQGTNTNNDESGTTFAHAPVAALGKPL
jgi:hypothetical protein